MEENAIGTREDKSQLPLSVSLCLYLTLLQPPSSLSTEVISRGHSSLQARISSITIIASLRNVRNIEHIQPSKTMPDSCKEWLMF